METIKINMGTHPFVTAARTVSLQPTLYRLRANKDGTITLQGLFTWNEGSLNGADWKDIPTVQQE